MYKLNYLTTHVVSILHTYDILVEWNQFYVDSFNIRVELLIIKLKVNNIKYYLEFRASYQLLLIL